MCQLTPKLIYMHQNKVFSAFLPNFIPKINKTGVLWYRGILWYIYLYVFKQKPPDVDIFSGFLLLCTFKVSN